MGTRRLRDQTVATMRTIDVAVRKSGRIMDAGNSGRTFTVALSMCGIAAGINPFRKRQNSTFTWVTPTAFELSLIHI